MRIRHLKIERFRGIRELEFAPGRRTVILGPNNAGKSTVLEALDLLLHSGRGRPRPAPTELDYCGRDPSSGFAIEAVVGELPASFVAEVRDHLEGWNLAAEELVPEPDGEGIEPVVRVRVRGTEDFDIQHEFAKDESNGARFRPGLRAELGWVFDGRTRDTSRQLAFYQGGVLDRLFGDADLEPAIGSLREALSHGAGAVNTEENILGVLALLADDLRTLGLIAAEQLPQFEVGGVSVRELLQSLRLTMPSANVQIPVSRQGRGAQRLLLVAILLRLAQAAGRPAIGGFEEPEEALEPLRQTQIARILGQIADRGGQIFVVTHSPEVARAFLIEDFLLLEEREGVTRALQLRKALSEPVRQSYERWLDGAVVRGLFARVAVLVEGPGDRAVIEVFWRSLAHSKRPEKGGPKADPRQPLRPMDQIGLDVINSEGARNMPMLAWLLDEAGKTVVAWVEQDVPEVIERLRREDHCDAYLLHDPADGRQFLEQALAHSASIAALAKALDALGTRRGYTWEDQRSCLVSTVGSVEKTTREAMKAAEGLHELLGALKEKDARDLTARALSAKSVSPFEMKGARQARIVAETIVDVDGGVPEPFARVLTGLADWVTSGCKRIGEISMAP